MGLKIKIKMVLPTSSRGIQALLLCWCMLLFACGGGGGNKNNLAPVSSKPALSPVSSIGLSSVLALSSISSTPSSVPESSQPSSSQLSSSQLSSAVSQIILDGKVTYDSVPHNDNKIGLDYSATTVKAARGLVVELLDSNNIVLATTSTDDLGNYSFSVELNKLVKVRVKAQLLRTQSPVWNYKVTDNTNGNSLYVMDGNLVAASEATAIRNLHAASGWTGASYTQPRVAAPFAILDSVLLGAERVVAAGNSKDFPSLELRWSRNNKPAVGDLTLGEIGTSFYDGSAIYILGDQNNDTDEYDRHVILHEWGHYLESGFSRSDSIGGDHVYDDKLDLRVAMSEGFANAFSAMMLEDPDYRDASGTQQNEGFSNNISDKNHIVRGWYSEASVQSILYNFYASNNGKTARNFTDIFNIISSTGYAADAAMISIYVFADELRKLIPGQITSFNNLLLEQNIEPTNAFGDGESNSGGYTGSLPIYKKLPPNNTPVNVCSTNRFGAYNKLAVAQFMVLDIAAVGTYRFSVQEAGDDSGNSDPDIYLYHYGELLAYAEGTAVGQESLTQTLPVGTYVLELVDDRAKNIENTDELTACFDTRALRLD
ncbi:MAG: hypothetical protein K0Q67_1606 [Cellvibrio sp.]|nr:hypothetical protein [Cellvibrio sp.]